jgi:hypothetical protein
MFMVRWDGKPPADRDEWIEAMRPVFLGAAGAYHVRFYPADRGWKFDLEWHNDPRVAGDLIANGPESVRFNLHQALLEAGKPLDPAWEN